MVEENNKYHSSKQCASVTPKNFDVLDNEVNLFSETEGEWWQKRFGLGNRKTKSKHIVLQTLSNSMVSSLSFSNSNSIMAVASGPRVEMYNMKEENLKKAMNYTSCDSPIECVEYRQGDGKVVAYGSQKGSIVVVDVIHRATLRKFKVKSSVHVVRWLPDGKHLIAAGDDGKVYLWDIEKDLGQKHPKPVGVMEGHTDSVRDVVVLPGKKIASASYDHTMRVWNSQTLSCLHICTAKYPLEALMVLQGSLVASVGRTNIEIWDTESGSLKCHSYNSYHAKTISCICYASSTQLKDMNGSRIITGGIDGYIRIHDADSLKCVYGVSYNSPISALQISPDGKYLVIGTSQGIISVVRRRDHLVKPKSTILSIPKAARSGTPFFNRKTPKHLLEVGSNSFLVDVKPKKQHISKFDALLKQFQFGEALDTAISMNKPHDVIAVIEELARREQGLRIALSNRDEIALEPILSFLIKNITNPNLTNILLHVTHIVLDIYDSLLIGCSSRIEELFDKLKQIIKKQIRTYEEMLSLTGQLEFVLNQIQA